MLGPRRRETLHTHRVIPRVDVERRPGHVAGLVGEQVRRRGAHVVGRDVAAERRPLLDDRFHRRETRNRAGGERPHGAGRDRVDADVLLAGVAGGNQRRIDRGRELANVALDPFPLVGEGEPGAAVGETLRDRPGDRALVGDAEDEAALAGEISHGGRVYGFSATLRGLRRAALLPLAAALILASAASATLQPIRRSYGEFSLPRVRAGTLKIPAASSHGRLTVLVDLRLPPLAAYNRNLFSAVSTSRLNVRSSSSRA